MNFRKLPIRRFGFMASVMMALCLLQSWSGDRTLVGQQILVRMDAGKNAQIEIHNQLKEVYESKLTAAKNRINSQLHDIDLACDLSAVQRERLKVASKGAVNAHAEKVLKEVESKAKEAGVNFNLKDPPEKETEDDEEEQDLRRGGLRVLDLGKTRHMVEAEMIWEKSVKKSLSEKQLEKLETWLSERKKLNRQAAVDHLIAKADTKMFLSRQQREKLKVFVDKEYGESLANKIGATPVQNRRFFAPGIQLQAPEIDVDDALKEILSEPQLEIWRTEIQNDLDSL